MQFFWTNKEAIRAYVLQHGRGPLSRDYEFVVAVILAMFLEEQLGRECHIGFQLKREYGEVNNGLMSLDQVAEVIKAQVDSDTAIDVAITPDTTATGKRRGISFQLKRFGRDPKQNNTEALILYLNKVIPRKYPPGLKATLMLIFETKEELDLPKVVRELNIDNYPFERIMYMGISNHKLLIGELYPNQGVTEYELQSLGMRSDGSSNL